MEIKKAITLNIKSTKNHIICSDTLTLQMVVGTSGVVGSLHMYNITKKDGKYYIPKNTIKERIQTLEQRKQKIEAYLSTMKQILNAEDGGD